MHPIEVRPFRRSDRDQLTDLVNAHTAAVIPGMTVSVSTVLSSLEQQPGEFIEDPWVSERATLVAEQASRVVAAAHLLRHYADERAGPAARNVGDISWFVYWSEAPAGNPCWPDATEAAESLMTACLAQFDRWQVSRQTAGGELPAPGVYGVPEQWPHISALYTRAGFEHKGHTEIVYLARVADLSRPASPPIPGMSVARAVGINGTRLSAMLDGAVIGYVEVETMDAGERVARHGGWADVGTLKVQPDHTRRGVGSWLLGQAAEWLELSGVDRLLDYAWLEGEDPTGQSYDADRAFLAKAGFRELTKTKIGWERSVRV